MPVPGSADGLPREGETRDMLRERLEFVLESASMGFWDLDLVANRTIRSLRHDQCFGHDVLLPEWTYDTFMAHLHPCDRSWVEQAYRDSMRGHGDFEVEFRVLWPDGSEHWLVSRGRFVFDAAGTPIRLGGVVADITARKAAERAALEADRRLSTLVDALGDAVVTSTLDGTVLSWNPAAEELFGWTAEQMVGRDGTVLLAPDSLVEFTDRRTDIAAGLVLTGLRPMGRRRDGSDVEVAVTLSPLRGADGSVVGSTAVLRDITHQRRLERDLERQALHDGLTGLANRALLADRLGHAIAAAQRGGTAVAVLVVDLDGFKAINDAAGHAIGDQLLVETASRLTGCLRPEDTVARSGGDEFVVVCERTDADEALVVAQRVHAGLAPALELEGRRFHISASVGIAVSPPLDAEALQRSADLAMYDAKSGGPGRTSLFLPPMAQRLHDERELAVELEDALARDQLQLHYQPVVDLVTGRLVGLEALARWQRPGRATVPPLVFVAVAGETGLTAALDRWVLHRACCDAAALVTEGLLGRDVPVSVNLGVRNVGDTAVAALVVDAVTAAGPGFDYGQLVVEVTEAGVLTSPTAARQVLSQLQALGVQVALDDFGTGSCSLAHLEQLPLSLLKLDVSRVREMDVTGPASAVLGPLLALAGALGLRTVAEGVEHPAQLGQLQRLGCDAGQGFLWSPALPLVGLRGLLAGLPGGRFAVGPGSRGREG